MESKKFQEAERVHSLLLWDSFEVDPQTLFLSSDSFMIKRLMRE